MENSFHQNEPQTQRPASFSGGLLIVNSVFKWLAIQLEMTQAQQEDAGVYLGGEGRD